MKKIFCVLALSAIFAACGNSGDGTKNTDSSGTMMNGDTSMHSGDSTNMMQDTMHKDTSQH